jgi:hypothetical protein
VPKSTHKRITKLKVLESIIANLPDPDRTGLPAQDSIIGVTTPIAVPMLAALGGAASDKQYTIIHTNEIDEYEEKAGALTLAPVTDDFTGKDRKAAKISISSAKTEKFKDVKALIKSLTPEDEMKNHKPKITTAQTSKRVKEEERNIHVSAFLYAAKREGEMTSI